MAARSATRPRRSSRVKDGRPDNTHPLNRGAYQDRIPLFESFLRFAEALARCSPARVASDRLRAGEPQPRARARRRLRGRRRERARRRDRRARGGSHLHAEEHALLIAGAVEKDKLMFVTEAPCYLCAVRALNSGVSHVYYRTAGARGRDGLELLRRAGKVVVQYPRWRPRGDGSASAGPGRAAPAAVADAAGGVSALRRGAGAALDRRLAEGRVRGRLRRISSGCSGSATTAARPA